MISEYLEVDLLVLECHTPRSWGCDLAEVEGWLWSEVSERIGDW